MNFEESNDKITLQGYLKKWTNPCSQWQQRYFTLRNNVLYYSKEKGMRYKGKMHIGVCDIIEDTKDQLKFNIDCGMKILYLKTEDMKERNDWVDALNYAWRKEQLVPRSKNKKPEAVLTTQNQAQANNNSVNEVSNKLILKRIYSTKDLLDELEANNTQLRDLKLTNKNERNYHNLLNNYKVDIH